MDTAAPSYRPPCPLSFIQREAAALKNEPPLLGRMKMYLLYDGFFFFCRRVAADLNIFHYRHLYCPAGLFFIFFLNRRR